MRNLLEDVKAERAKYGAVMSSAERGRALNRIAWTNRDDGWGLSRKDFGEHAQSPAGLVANNVLHHRPENQIVQVFGSKDGADVSNPVFNVVPHHNHPARPWVAPVDPDDVDPGGGGAGDDKGEDEFFNKLVEALLVDTERLAMGVEAIAKAAQQLVDTVDQGNARLDRVLEEGLRLRFR